MPTWARMGGSMKYRTAMIAVVTLACGGGGEDNTVAPPPPPGVETITLAASRQSIVTGDSVAVTADVRDTQGRAVTGKTLAWTSSQSSVATVSSAGMVKAIGEGDATITASVDGKSASLAFSVKNIFLETNQ